MFTITDIMTDNPYSLKRSHTLMDAKQLMAEHNIRHIPIVDSHHKLVGLITQRDVLAAQESNLQKSVHDDGSYSMNTALEKVMNRSVVSVSSHAGLRQSACYMQKHKYGCLPVTHNGKLIGIITDSDFVAVAINLLEIMEEGQPESVDLE